MVLAEADYFQWVPHPEVWLLVGGLIALYTYAGRVIGPKAVPAGTAPISHRQRGWFVGGVRTVRGQIAGTQDGDAFWLARGEVGTKQGVFRPVGFFDVGWAGSRNAVGKVQPQRGAGVGIGVLDGLIRVDFSRGLYPLKRWRTDFYVSAAL